MCFIRVRKVQLSVLVLVVVLTMVLSGCDNLNTAESAPPPSETSNQQSESNDIAPIVELNIGDYTTSYEYTADDTNSAWDNNAATITFDGNNAQVSGSGASFTDGTLTIKQAGTYVLSGTLANGQVLIDAKNSDVVRLVLNGLTLHNEIGPAIYAPQSEKVVLILAEGTVNTISDGADYTLSDDANEPYAAIFAQDDLSITGNGTLTVIGNCKHGIRSQDILVITGGEINVTAVGDALRGRDGVVVLNGNIALNAEGDGIQSNNADDDARGYVIINGGTFNIQAKNDGIQAESALTVTGGNLEIITGGGSANAPTRQEDFRGGGGGWGGGQPNANSNTTADDSISMKALKAGKQVIIAGGDIVIDAEDDAVHSNDTLFIMDGNLFIKTGDDGIHADAAVEISGGKIDIPVCYEGIEGLSVTISGGDILVIASDDAINAAGGVDSATPGGGPMGGDRFAVNGDIFIKISGGNLDLYAPCDGIDSNGNIFMEGGTVKISGPSQGMEGAIDLDGTMLITGGELITAGSVLNVSSESTQPTILVSYSQQQVSGSVITMKDANGDILLEYTSAISYTLSGFTSPSFIVGETYTLYIDGEKKVDITLGVGVTSIADDGGAYNGGMGGGRGNWGGGGMPGGQMPSGERGDWNGEMPSGGRMPTDGEMPSGGRPSGAGGMPPDGGEMPSGTRPTRQN